jgi:nucleoside-diphosphate-sugar epimerase
MARILLTGGAGYVGSHCAKALAAAGHEGIVFHSLLFGHRDLAPIIRESGDWRCERMTSTGLTVVDALGHWRRVGV